MRTFVEEELEEKESLRGEPDTEITLGMKSLLGVFFGSVLVCGVFFGFGYSLGRGNPKPGPEAAVPRSPAVGVAPSTRSDEPTPLAAATPTASSDSPTPQPTATGDSGVKTVVSDPAVTASGSSAATAPDSDGQYEYVATPQGPARRPIGAPPKSKPHAGIMAGAPGPQSPVQTAYAPVSQPVVQQPALTAAPPARPAVPPPAPAATPKPAAIGSVMVQIAAISRQEDAEILVSALRKRGYSVVVRNDPKDSLLHVQLGPFSRDDAKAMRTRLLGDGYNAILK